jgi:CRP-like cAMP-binding protein
MNNSEFSDFIYSNVSVDKEAVATLAHKCRSAVYGKNEFLLRQGEICGSVFFVEKGLLRQYSIDDKGKEHILMFAPETWFVADRGSIFFNEPSNYFIQALEQSKVMLIGESVFQQLAKDNPAFQAFNNKLLHNHIRSLQKRITSLLGATAEERYLDFIKTYPDVLARVPQIMVASYLGITPESLSRIRRDLASKT